MSKVVLSSRWNLRKSKAKYYTKFPTVIYVWSHSIQQCAKCVCYLKKNEVTEKDALVNDDDFIRNDVVA